MQGGSGLVLASFFAAALAACQDGSKPDPVAAGPSSSVASSTPSASVAASLVATAPSAPAYASPSGAPPLSPRRRAFLQADVAKRLEIVQRSRPPALRAQTVADTFLVAAGDGGGAFDATVTAVQRLSDILYAGPLAHRSDLGATLWVYSSAASLESGARAHLSDGVTVANGQFGAYDDALRVVVVRTDSAGVGSSLHEIAHVLLGDDYPMAPFWLKEGSAALFEVTDFSKPGEVHFKAHYRLQTLRDVLNGKAGKENDLEKLGIVRLEYLFDPQSRFAGDDLEHIHMASAREALRWMDAQGGKLWEFWAYARDHALDEKNEVDPHGPEKAFTHVMGKTPAEATPEWLAWIKSKAAEGTP